MMMKVVCGILIWNDKVLIGKRTLTNPTLPGKWEFPGGKVEDGESYYEAIKREFMEELDIDVYPFHELRTLSDDKMEFTPMCLKLIGGKAKLNDHDEVKFVTENEFFEMDLTKYSREAGKILFGSYNIFLRKGE